MSTRLPVMGVPGLLGDGDKLAFSAITTAPSQTLTLQRITPTGEIWYEIGAGDWAQAYTGHTTGIGQIIAADAICMMSIPHQVSFDLPPQFQEALKNSGY